MAAANRPSSSPNVYTALAIIATIALGIAVAYVWRANTSLTGQSAPWAMIGQQ